MRNTQPAARHEDQGRLAQADPVERLEAPPDGRLPTWARALAGELAAEAGLEPGAVVEEAEAKGANAIIAMRFDTSEFMEQATEICAYGTAVTAAFVAAQRS